MSMKVEDFPGPNGIKRAKDQTLTHVSTTDHEKKGEKEKTTEAANLQKPRC